MSDLQPKHSASRNEPASARCGGMRPIAGGCSHNEYGGTPLKITPGAVSMNNGSKWPENFRWDGDDPVRGEQRAEDMSISQRVGHRQLRQDTSRQPEVDANREHVPAAKPASGADHELRALQAGGQCLDHGIHHDASGIDDRSPTNLDDVHVREHAEHRRLASPEQV